MKMLSSTLSAQKPSFLARFLSVLRRPVPGDIRPPEDPGEALKVGYLLGLRDGYGEGLVDGVDLGTAVGSLDVVVDEPEIH